MRTLEFKFLLMIWLILSAIFITISTQLLRKLENVVFLLKIVKENAYENGGFLDDFLETKQTMQSNRSYRGNN